MTDFLRVKSSYSHFYNYLTGAKLLNWMSYFKWDFQVRSSEQMYQNTVPLVWLYIFFSITFSIISCNKTIPFTNSLVKNVCQQMTIYIYWSFLPGDILQVSLGLHSYLHSQGQQIFQRVWSSGSLLIQCTDPMHLNSGIVPLPPLWLHYLPKAYLQLFYPGQIPEQ